MTAMLDLCEFTIDVTRYDLDTLRRPGVLLAAGELIERLELAGGLAGHGFDVWTAGSGMDALRAYVEHAGTVDVLVIDAGLPDLPGLAFLRRFRSHFPGVPCVFLIDPAGRALDLVAAGAVVVPRPVGPEELSARLWEVVAGEGIEVG